MDAAAAPDRRSSPTPRGIRPWHVLLVVAGALVFQVRAGGLEPLLVHDTQGEERHVKECLDFGACPLEGVGSSVRNVRFGTTWRDLRIALEAVGLGPESIHLGLSLLAAIAAALALLVAARTAGPGLAGVAAILFLVLLYPPDGNVDRVLLNTRMLRFLGILTTALLVLAVERRSLVELVAAAVMAGFATEIHPASGTLVVPAAVAALLLPRPVRAIAAAAAAFAATLALSPATWIGNARALLEGSPVPPATAAQAYDHPYLLLCTAAALVVPVVIHRRDARVRGPWLILFATLASAALAHEALGRVLVGSRPSPTYLLPWAGVSAAAQGALVAWAVASVASRLRASVARGPLVSPRAGSVVLGASVVAAAAALALWPGLEGTWPQVAGNPKLTLPEALSVGQAVRQRGWSLQKAFRDLKGPAQREVAGALGVWMPWTDPTAPGREGESATVLKVRPGALPDPLPDGFERVRTSREGDVVIAWTRAGLDWARFRACVSAPGAQPQCTDTGIEVGSGPLPDPVLPGLPLVRPHEAPVVTLAVPLAADGPARVVLRMPREPMLCSGRIADLTPGFGAVAADGLSALLERSADAPPPGRGPGTGRGEVTFRWRIGTDECPPGVYLDYPPFVIEAVPDRIDLVAGLAEVAR